MSKTREELLTSFNPKSGRMVATIGWYNQDYMIVNGLILKNQAHAALCNLIDQGLFEDLGDAIRQAVALLLIDKAKYLQKDHGMEHGLLEVFKTIQRIRDPGDMAPDGCGMRKVKVLDQMLNKVKDDP
jgi:hypothetical protein